MVKVYLLIVMILSCGFSIIAQDENRDNIWLMGYGSNDIDSTFGGTIIDFTTGEPTFSYEYRDLNFHLTNASICDDNGDLLFYTNGISLVNGNNEIVENGDTLIVGQLTETWAEFGIRVSQAALILPKPGSSEIYGLFQTEIEAGNFQNNGIIAPRLHYFEIDMNANDNQGSVTLQNEIILTDTLSFGHLTATKHANGIDWWIIVPEASSNRFYTLLLTEDGVLQNEIQELGDTCRSGVGQAVFSPDGSKYARANSIQANEAYLDLYEFDRCTGLLTNHQQVLGIGRGLSFSSNSRFLYCTTSDHIFQIDTDNPNISSSIDTVAIYDGFETPTEIPIPTKFYFSQLAPNGKIYIICSATIRYMHVINQPDLQGISCDVAQHSILLPTKNLTSIPNYPNFSLGALEESFCDTIRPIAQFSYEVNDLSMSFQDESLRSPTEWFWTFGDGETSELQHPVHNYASSNTYEVCLKVTNEAGSDSTCQIIDLMVDVEETSVTHTINISPNPTKKNVLFTINGHRNRDWKLKFYDVVGKELLEKTIFKNQHQLSISLSDYPRGVYFYKIEEEDKVVKVGKVVRE